MHAPFADRLIEATRRAGPLCVGLDPMPEHIPALFGRDERALEPFLLEILELAAARAAAVKPQLGFFEAYGAEGFKLAHELTREAQAKGLIVVLDAKRGDIGSTAEGYARATLGRSPGFDSDAVTVNPYLGKDSLEPFLRAAEDRRKGVAVLVRTSNPGARDVQDLQADGAPVWTHVGAHDRQRSGKARRRQRLVRIDGCGRRDMAGGSARAAQAAAALSLLVPGFGAQGASAADAVAGFVAGPGGLEGGIVSASRAILYPDGARSASTLAAWREQAALAMDRATADLAAAIAR